MSGIFGFFYCNERSSDELKENLDKLNAWNTFYGHDGNDAMQLQNAGIGYCIEHFSDDIPCEKKVLYNYGLVAVIDALIYNRGELCSALHLQSDFISDEQLLLLWIEKNGYSALSQVNGDFAGAIFDEKKHIWTLFRDHMGIRPLFYYQDEKMFAFSTDIRGLAALSDVDLKINEKQLYLRIMGYNELSLCETEFSNIRCLKPGSWCTVQQTEQGYVFCENIYWELGKNKIRFASEKEYQQEMRRLVEDAVKCRLDTVPGVVGGELSGGLDSCVIDILIHRLGRDARFFSWSFDPKEHPIQPNDERLIIKDVCSREKITCDYLSTKMQSYLDTLDQINPPYINTTNIRETAKYLRASGVRAVFTGHGGDEGVSHRCSQMELWHHREYLPFLKEKWKETGGKKFRLLRTLKHTYYSVTKEYLRLSQPWKGISPAAMIFRKEFLDEMKQSVYPQPLYFPFDVKAYIEQGGSRNRLDNVAFQGAEYGIRYLVPFLDYRVIDFAVSIPRWLYRRGDVNRYIFREAFRDLMPDALYTLNTKETPSMMNYKPKEQEGISFEQGRNALLERLDEQFWSQYLDFNMVRKCLQVPQKVTEKAFYQIAFCMNQLYLCLMIQNVQNNASKRSSTSEK